MSGDQRTVIKGNPSQYVKLNVGGCLYYTTIGTLTKVPETMLQAMFSGRMEVLTDPEGWILIDRCGKHFGTILNYLRDGNVGLPTNSQELEEILAEAKFYCIAGLINLCEKTLENRNSVLSPVCQVPFITSEDERKQFIANATKPVVELLINRHNNKYSYTNTSDENLLKNLEMFDRLALRFNGRIHFIKDAIGPSEICCWRFYGNGKKFAEVCCTSIVYATDRKHTKVEFPEARIYEETLNSFLYENRPGPDQELMRATSVGGVFGVGGVGVTSCTSDEEEDRRNHHRSSNMTKSSQSQTGVVDKNQSSLSLSLNSRGGPSTSRCIRESRSVSTTKSGDSRNTKASLIPVTTNAQRKRGGGTTTSRNQVVVSSSGKSIPRTISEERPHSSSCIATVSRSSDKSSLQSSSAPTKERVKIAGISFSAHLVHRSNSRTASVTKPQKKLDSRKQTSPEGVKIRNSGEVIQESTPNTAGSAEKVSPGTDVVVTTEATEVIESGNSEITKSAQQAKLESSVGIRSVSTCSSVCLNTELFIKRSQVGSCNIIPFSPGNAACLIAPPPEYLPFSGFPPKTVERNKFSDILTTKIPQRPIFLVIIVNDLRIEIEKNKSCRKRRSLTPIPEAVEEEYEAESAPSYCLTPQGPNNQAQINFHVNPERTPIIPIGSDSEMDGIIRIPVPTSGPSRSEITPFVENRPLESRIDECQESGQQSSSGSIQVENAASSANENTTTIPAELESTFFFSLKSIPRIVFITSNRGFDREIKPGGGEAPLNQGTGNNVSTEDPEKKQRFRVVKLTAEDMESESNQLTGTSSTSTCDVSEGLGSNQLANETGNHNSPEIVISHPTKTNATPTSQETQMKGTSNQAVEALNPTYHPVQNSKVAHTSNLVQSDISMIPYSPPETCSGIVPPPTGSQKTALQKTEGLTIQNPQRIVQAFPVMYSPMHPQNIVPVNQNSTPGQPYILHVSPLPYHPGHQGSQNNGNMFFRVQPVAIASQQQPQPRHIPPISVGVANHPQVYSQIPHSAPFPIHAAGIPQIYVPSPPQLYPPPMQNTTVPSSIVPPLQQLRYSLNNVIGTNTTSTGFQYLPPSQIPNQARMDMNSFAGSNVNPAACHRAPPPQVIPNGIMNASNPNAMTSVPTFQPRPSATATASKQTTTATASQQTATATASRQRASATASRQTSTATASRQTSTATASKQTATASASKQTATASASKQTSTVFPRAQGSKNQATQSAPNNNAVPGLTFHRNDPAFQNPPNQASTLNGMIRPTVAARGIQHPVLNTNAKKKRFVPIPEARTWDGLVTELNKLFFPPPPPPPEKQ